MYIKFLFIFICLALLEISCKEKKSEVELDIPVETIDFLSLKRYDVDLLPDKYVKNRRYIKLDTTENFFIKEIRQVKVKNDKIYILDWHQKSILIFDMEGKGLAKLYREGHGPEEYIRIHDFEIDDDENIYAMDGTADKLHIYDANLNFISVTDLPFEIEMIKCLPNGKFFIGLTTWNYDRNAGDKLVITDKNLNVEQAYMKFDEYIDNARVIGYADFVTTPEHIIYHLAINDYVYLFDHNGQPKKAVYFDFGSHKVPNEEKKDLEKYWNNFDNYYAIRDLPRVDDKYIIANMRLNNNNKICFIDRQTREMYIKNPDGEIGGDLGGYTENGIIYYYKPLLDEPEINYLPEDIMDYLKKENYVLAFIELN